MAKRRGQPSAVNSPPPPGRQKAKWMLYALGGGFIVMSAVGVAEELPALVTGSRAEAEVVTIHDEGPDVYSAELQIPGVGSASTVRLNRYRRLPPLRVGQRVAVAYTRSEASSPALAVPLNSAARWPGSAMFSCLGAFLLWLARRQ